MKIECNGEDLKLTSTNEISYTKSYLTIYKVKIYGVDGKL